MCRFFNRKVKPKKGDLETALKLGLISEEELLRIKLERAEMKLKKFLDRDKKKRK